jgi:hypothetical protein
MDKIGFARKYVFNESLTFHINHFLTVYAQILGNRRTDRYDLNARYSSI